MNPLAKVRSIKLKLGIVIVLAILVTLLTMVIAAYLGARLRYGALAALVVSLASVQLVARGMTAPLRQMAKAANAMARGEHGQRVHISNRDEIGELASAFNTMASELDALDRSRREFVADAAHELRTPIAALRASLENAADGVEEADVGDLLIQVGRLEHLAEQLLDLSALEAGGAELEVGQFKAGELASDCNATVDIPPDLTIRGDRDRLRQVVRNLVDNAHRHAPGSHVVLSAIAGPQGSVRLEVVDDGPGIDERDASRVFDRFARTDRSRSRPGSGLGLAIARSIVELHGGTIHAERADPHGCRMVIDLPQHPTELLRSS